MSIQFRTQCYRDNSNKWRFRVVGTNGEKILASEAYSAHARMRKTVDRLFSTVKTTAWQLEYLNPHPKTKAEGVIDAKTNEAKRSTRRRRAK